MRSAKVRYAAVGLGDISQVAILPAFKTATNSELVAIVSGDAEKRIKLGKKYRLNHVYSYNAYDRALAAVNAVYIAVPNHLHHQYAVRALNAGVHVLCEKPMAVTEEECAAMIHAAAQNNVKLMIAYRLHFERGNLQAVRLASTGKLGELRFFASEFAQNVSTDNIRLAEPVERGGGPVYDMGVYCINAARYLFQAEPTEVLATAANGSDPKFRKAGEMMSVSLRFPEDRLATFTCSFGAADIGRYTLVGTKGSLTADPAYEYVSAIKFELKVNDKKKILRFPKRDQFAAEISYFSDCIRKNKDPEPSGLEGLADVRIVQAIYESARAAKSVKIEAVPKNKRPSPRQQIYRKPHGEPEKIKAESPGEAA